MPAAALGATATVSTSGQRRPPLQPVPDLQELLALRGAAHDLTLSARASVRAALYGLHGSAQRGRGMEFEEVRPYVPGDDPRNIDWRVTARRGRPHTKLFREERERPVWLLVDLSKRLFFGTRRQLKSALSVRAAALLAWVAALGGDRVGAVVSADGQCRVLPPRSRQAGVLPLLEALVAMQPTAPGFESAQHAASGERQDALRTLAALVRPGCLALILDDFATLGEAEEPQYLALAAAADCRLLWVTDVLEEQALPDGRFRVGVPGAVGARIFAIDGAAVRPRWQSSWRERETRLTRLAQRTRSPLIRLDTRASAEEALRPVLQRVAA